MCGADGGALVLGNFAVATADCFNLPPPRSATIVKSTTSSATCPLPCAGLRGHARSPERSVRHQLHRPKHSSPWSPPSVFIGGRFSRIRPAEGRRRACSTCLSPPRYSSCLSAVLQAGRLHQLHICPRGPATLLSRGRVVSVVYTFITAILNP